MPENQRKDKALKAAVDELMQFYDTVQVFVTKYKGDENDATQGQVFGRGNLFARLAHIELWIEKVHAQLLEQELPQNPEDTGDDAQVD